MTYAVEELQRAVRALNTGQFRTGRAAGHPRRRAAQISWQPAEQVIIVAGAAPRVGSTTVALAVTEVAEGPARVVEAAPMHTTGLAAATTAELGVTTTGWRQASRGRVFIERTTVSYDDPADVPPPEPTDRALTVIDVGWDLNRLKNCGGWLGDLLDSAPLVLVTAATAPAIRALDAALFVTGRPAETTCVVVGARPKKWPRQLQLAITGAIENVADAGRLHTVPEVRALALTGLTTDSLPPHLVAACAPILDHAVVPTKGLSHVPV